jgi:hypothetical protein
VVATSLPTFTIKWTASKALDFMIAFVLASLNAFPSGRRSTISPVFACRIATAFPSHSADAYIDALVSEEFGPTHLVEEDERPDYLTLDGREWATNFDLAEVNRTGTISVPIASVLSRSPRRGSGQELKLTVFLQNHTGPR